MTERGNEPSQTFYELVGPVIDDARDPAIVSLMDTIWTHELNMNLLEEVSDKQKDKVEDVINKALDDCDIPGKPVVITGKLRPFPEGAFDSSEASEKRKKEIEKIFGTVFYDDDGNPYFLVQHAELIGGYSCTISGYEDDSDEDDEEEYGLPKESSHTILLQLNLKASGNPYDADLYVVPHEIEEFNPTTPSDAMVEQLLRTHYPKILEQLNKLPDTHRDSAEILQSLRELEVEVDHVAYPDGAKNSKALRGYIERYLTKRVQFDKHLHSLMLQHCYFGFDSNGKEIKETIDHPIPITAYVERIVIKKTKNRSDDRSASPKYEPWLQIIASAPASDGREEAYYTIRAPLSSIDGLTSLRNPELFSSRKSKKDRPRQKPLSTDKHEIVPAREVTPADTSAHGPEFTVDTDPMGLLQNREALLSGVKQRFHELFQQVDRVVSQVYAGAEAAIAARDRLTDIISEFLDLFPEKAGILIEAEGVGVMSIPAKLGYDALSFDPESNMLNIPVENVQLQTHDILNPAKGFLSQVIDVRALSIDDDPEGDHRVEACLYLISSNDEIPAAVRDGYHELPMYELTPKTRIAIELDAASTKITIPEYERIVRCRETITRIAMTYPDQRRLSMGLDELHNTLLEADPFGFSPMSDASLLHMIGKRVGGDEEVTYITNDALTDMFRDRQIKITGGMYMSTGAYVHNHTAAGVVKDVVATTPAIASSEPMIVVADDEQKDWYVPLSTVKHLEY